MRTTTNATVTDDFEPALERVRDVGDAVHRRRRTVELAPPVVGDHDRRSARIGCLATILRRQNALDNERTAPLLGKPLDVLPRQ